MHNKQKRRELNFNTVVRDLEKVLAAWKWRNLTLYGRL